MYRLNLRWLLLSWGLGLTVGCGSVESTTALSRQLNEQELQTGKLVALQDSTLPAKRQIIYSASIQAETEEMEEFGSALRSHLPELGGFVADFHQQRYAGNQQRSVWTVRVDASKFSELIAWLNKHLHVTATDIESQDMTEEFVDLQARVANKKNTEQRLASLLAEHPGKLEDVLSVEREIDRVREEIERIEGRLRFIEERTALSTVRLTVSTRVRYVPEQEPSFATRVAETWHASLSTLVEFGQGIALWAVGLAPWIPLLLLAAGLFYAAARLAYRRLASPLIHSLR